MSLQRGLVVGCVLLYLVVWALLTPLLMAPDEASHLIKALSLPSSPWVATSPEVEIRGDLDNPLLRAPHLRTLPGYPQRKLGASEIADLRRAEWPPAEASTARFQTAAHIYPPLYYAVLLGLGEAATVLFSLSPYASIYAFRAVSAVLAALLWTAVFARLGFLGRPRAEVFALLVLVPMIALLGSSISPDAVFIPLCALVMLSSFEAIFRGRSLRTAAALLLALAFTKSAAALLVVPTLAGLVGIGWLAGRLAGRDAVHWRNAAILIVVVPAVFYAAFYHWSPAFPVEVFPERFHKTLPAFLAELPAHAMLLFASFWLALGLPDTLAPWPVYSGLLVLWTLNAAVFAWRFRELEEKGRFCFLMGFALLYGVALLAGEYVYFARTAYILQGRYFLPVALGFFLVAAHPIPMLRRAFVLLLVGFNLYAIHLGVERYYAGDWNLVWRAMPFSG